MHLQLNRVLNKLVRCNVAIPTQIQQKWVLRSTTICFTGSTRDMKNKVCWIYFFKYRITSANISQNIWGIAIPMHSIDTLGSSYKSQTHAKGCACDAD